MNNLNYALIYLKKYDISVIPTRGKKPLIAWEKYAKEKPSEQQVEDWFTKWPYADIAGITGAVSNLIVIDIDGGEVPQLPPTSVSQTSLGHFQYFFTNPGFLVQNSSKVIGPNIDVRGNGGFVVLPPSNHYGKEGKVDFTYTWLVPPKEGGFAELPQWIIEKLQAKSKFNPQVLQGVPEGRRNQGAASVVGKILRGLNLMDWETVGWQMVTGWNLKNRPPLSEQELRTVFNSIVKRESLALQPSQASIPPIVKNWVFEPIWADELKTQPNIAVNWVVEGILAKGYISLLGAREKVGKTSLVSSLLKALTLGGDFLGQSVTQSRVLVISEEKIGHWNRRIENLGLSDCKNLCFVSQPFISRAKLKAWEDFLTQDVTQFCVENQIDVFVIDTISPIWPVLDENHASEVQTALLPLVALAKKNIAVFPIHHYNKAGGLRGSTVLGAVPDILLDFGLPPGDEDTTRRLLKIRSRFEESLPQLLLGYKDQEYILLGVPSQVIKREKFDAIKKTLVDFPEGATVQDLLSDWNNDFGKKPSRSALKLYLSELCESGEICQVGTRKIKGGKAFIYFLYPGNNNNYQGSSVLGKNEANNPNNHDRGYREKTGSIDPKTEITQSLKKVENLSNQELTQIFEKEN